MDNDYKHSTGRWRHHRGHQRPDLFSTEGCAALGRPNCKERCHRQRLKGHHSRLRKLVSTCSQSRMATHGNSRQQKWQS